MSIGIDYLVCAAGEGHRMKALGIKTPKPCIKLLGESLLEFSLKSFDFEKNDQLIIVTQISHDIPSNLEKKIQKLYPKVRISWLQIDHFTSGQLATAWLARNQLRGGPVAIYNSDTYFKSTTLKKKMTDNSFDGIIPCSRELGEEWSFCKVDEKNKVLEVAEKIRISNLASTGFYHFKSKDLFTKYAEVELVAREKEKGETFVAPMYNRLIQDGYNIHMDEVVIFKPMGTPEQIDRYWGVVPEELVKENQS